MIPAGLPQNEYERLKCLIRCGVLDTPPDPRFDDLVQVASMVCDAPIALVSLVDETRQWFKARVGLAVPETSRDVAFCAHVVESGERLLVEDASLDPRFVENPLVTQDPHFRFYAGSPIIVDGMTMGTLCVLDYQPRSFEDRTFAMLDALARLGSQLFEDSRRRAELEEAVAARELSESRAVSLFSLAHDLVVVVDAAGRVVQLSSSWEPLLGVVTENIVGTPFVEHLHSDDRLSARSFIQSLYEEPLGSFDCRVRKVDGSDALMQWTASPDPLSGNVYLVGRDITEQRRLEDMKSAFVSTVSHELRTPLTSIRGALGLVVVGTLGEVEPPILDMLHIANRNATHMVRIINDILDVDRIQTQGLVFEYHTVDLTLYARDAVHEQLPFASSHSVDVVWTGLNRPCVARVDSGRLRQVLDNLLINAIRHSGSGTKVELGLLESEAGWRFEVRDEGEGVPLDFQERLFDRFSQADHSDRRSNSGSGLGLHIAKAIIESHGGEIGYLRRGEKTVFWFELPKMKVT